MIRHPKPDPTLGTALPSPSFAPATQDLLRGFPVRPMIANSSLHQATALNAVSLRVCYFPFNISLDRAGDAEQTDSKLAL